MFHSFKQPGTGVVDNTFPLNPHPVQAAQYAIQVNRQECLTFQARFREMYDDQSPMAHEREELMFHIYGQLESARREYANLVRRYQDRWSDFPLPAQLVEGMLLPQKPRDEIARSAEDLLPTERSSAAKRG